MRYDLECGHCGYQFVLDVGALPRTVKCTVCGGVLTLAVPVPIDPPPTPPAPPKPPPKPSPSVVPAPVPPVLDHREPPEWSRRLAEPWPLIRNWLNAERVTIDFGRYLYCMFLCMSLLGCPRERTAAGVAGETFAWLIPVLLVPAIFHLCSQVILFQTPHTHGGATVRVSARLLVLASILSVIGGVADEPVAVVPAVLIALASFGFWLAFLGRLGRSLGDDALTSAARAYRVWFPFGLVLFAAFLMGAVMAAAVPSPLLIWCGRAAAGVLSFILLHQYAALLRAAVDAIDRRAPAAPRR